jgi:PPOX class probable F420-dependent enzyme
MSVELAGEVREKFEEPNFWHLATINPDGSPQTTVVWAHTRDGRILVNTALNRIKPRNIRHDPRVAISVYYAENPYANIQIQGRVVETITGEQAENDIDMLSEKYTGQTPYPWRGEGEQRVSFLIEPTRVFHRPPRPE